MLNLSPIFGAFFSTFIMLFYALIETELKLDEIGIILKIFPLTFLIMIFLSYILYLPIKIIFLNKEKKNHFKEMWEMFFVIVFSIGLSSIIGGATFLFENNLKKMLFIILAFSSNMIFTYSFYVSLRKQLLKNNTKK